MTSCALPVSERDPARRVSAVSGEVERAQAIPVPDDVDKPFYDACNEERLVVQHCAACNRFQFPPRAMCPKCGNRALAWREIAGRGRIVSRVVVYDSPASKLIPDQQDSKGANGERSVS